MDDEIDEMIVSVRADTRAFAADMQQMRGTLDSTLVDGFDQAGKVLERSLLAAIRKGGLGFEDLKRIAGTALDQIAERALQLGLDRLIGGAAGGGFAAILGGAVGSLLGLPGRATGGLVAPDRPYLVGERGPELFVPTSAGRVDPGNVAQTTGREVRVSINLTAPKGSSAPVALQRSSRQVASAVRRALSR
ncbi:tail tape measure protein [Qipengyuania flava]|nr:tail tape measure protein [Qipengyuania flava]